MLLQINSSQVRDNAIITQLINNSAVTTAKIANGAVDENKLAASVAGAGLSGGGGTTLSVNVDNSTLEIATDSLQVKDGGISNAKLGSGIDATKIADGSVDNTEFQYLNGVTSAIQTQIDSKVAKAGDTMSGQLVISSGGLDVTGGTASDTLSVTGAATFAGTVQLGDATADTVTVNGNMQMGASATLTINAPSQDLHAATKAYVDAIAQGLMIRNAVRAATTAALPAATYDNGTSGVGATLTANANGALGNVDGVALIVGDRLLVKDQASGLENGVYDVTAVGDGSNPWVLTRSSDFDDSPTSEITDGTFVFVGEGTVNADSGWVQTSNETITVGTTALTFTQFSGAGQVTAGAGLTKTGNQIDVVAGDGLVANADDLQLVLDGSTLSKSASGLKVADLGIGTGQLAAGAVTDAKVATGIDAAKIADGSVSNTEFQYIGGLTSDAQTQLNAKVNSADLASTANGDGAALVGIEDAGTYYTGGTVEAALQEIGSSLASNSSDLTTHLNDTTDAHDASAISFVNTTSGLTATDVQAAIDEVEGRLDTAEGNISTNTSNISANDADIADLEAALGSSTGLAGMDYTSTNYVTVDTTAVAAISALDTQVKTNADGLAAHLADTTDAHDASAISVSTITNMTATDVQAALAELQGDIDDLSDGTTLDSRYVNVTGDSMTGALNVTVAESGAGLNDSGSALVVVSDDSDDAAVSISNSSGAALNVTGAASFSANVTIGGDLTVSGTTTYLNTTEVQTGDNNILLNADITASAQNTDGGVTVKRFNGSEVQTDAIMQWNETGDYWEAGISGDMSELVRYAELNASGGAAEVGIADAGAYFTSTNVEGALQELAADIAGQSFAANAISYDNSTSGLTATNVQAAIDEVEGRLDTAESNISTNTTNISTNATDISNLEAAVGSSTGLAGLAYTEDNVVADGESLETSIDKLDMKFGDLASTAAGEGSALVGIEDAGSYFTGTTVEAALQELGAAVGGSDAALQFGYKEYEVQAADETANGSGEFAIELADTTDLDAEKIQVYLNGALQVGDLYTGSVYNKTYSAYRKDNAGTGGVSRIVFRTGSLVETDIVQVHYRH